MNILLANKKISQATHNISAYRIKTDSGSILQVLLKKNVEMMPNHLFLGL